MNTILKVLLVGIMALFSCTIVKAQDYSLNLVGGTLIYSNSFTGTAGVNITNTPADFESGTLGGKSGTNWIEGLGHNDTNALYANGVMGTAQGNSWLLPFVPQAGFVYTLNVKVNYAGDPGTSIGAGFANYHSILSGQDIPGGNARFNSGGVDWAGLTYSSENLQAFGGPNTVLPFLNQNGIWSPQSGLHTITMVLDTTAAKWVCACYIDGHQGFVGGVTNFATNPSILGVGLEQNGANVNLNNNTFTWNGLVLAADTLVLTRNPASATVSAGIAFTNSVLVSCSTPGYQWYTNGVAINGANTNILVFNPVTAANANSDYYCVITNSTTSVTSAPASLTVYTAPVITTTFPITYTNITTLYGAQTVGGTNYAGATPTFTVSALGQAPLSYQWLTNGVAVGGATGVSFTFTNSPLTGPTNFTCMVTNASGLASNTWLVSYLPAPMAPFPSLVMSFGPTAFWRLNEPDDGGDGNIGTFSIDYAGANNGIYNNVLLGDPGYTNVFTNGIISPYVNTDTSDAAMRLTLLLGNKLEVAGIQDPAVDFATTNGGNTAFTVQAWVKGSAQSFANATIIAKGPVNGEQFAMDVTGGKWRFLYRTAANAQNTLTAAAGPDGAWHLLAGVVDTAHGNISFYVDGLTAGSAAITPGTGVFSVTNSITIGARPATPVDTVDSAQFLGDISDVAIYKRALTAGQVAQIYTVAGGTVASAFVVPLPPTNYVYLTGATISIPATFFGTPPMGYVWTNVTVGGILQSGQTNVFGNMDCTLVIPNAPTNFSGQVLELIVTNATFTTNWFVTMFTPAPPIQLDYSNSILYSNFFNGGKWSQEGMPLTAENILVGGTNTTWHLVTNNAAAGFLATADGTFGAGFECVIVPFTPHSGYVYTLEGSLTFQVTPAAGSWSGLGFSGQYLTNSLADPRIFNNWTLLNMFANGGGSQLFSNSVVVGATPSLMTVLNTPYDIKLVLDTTAAQWSISLTVAGTLVKTAVYTAGNPIIKSFGYQQTTTAAGVEKWNYISLTQTAPDGSSAGVPYVINSATLPTSITTGAGNPLSIPVSAFGAVPIGYSWSNTNTATALGSGTTNTIAPLDASLTVASVPSSWNGNTLALVLTNSLGTNVSFIVLNVTNGISLTVTNIGVTLSNNNLYLTWPVDHTGYTLQAQTNSLAIGISTNWVDVPTSTSTNQIVVPINKANDSVFYRLYLNH